MPQPRNASSIDTNGNHLWAIIPERLAELRTLMSSVPSAPAAREGAPGVRAGRGITPLMRGSVGVVPLHGFIFHRPNMWTDYGFGCACTDLAATLDQLMGNPDVKAIILDVDSPGGEVNGVQELALRLQAAAAEKRIVAVANSLMASAAYWLSAPASEIVATPSAMVGSIGVYWEHYEYSGLLKTAGITPTLIKAGKYKAEGNDSEPLSDEAKAHMQELVDANYDDFVKAVAKGREDTPAAVKSGYGEGRVLTAKLALEAKLVDRIGTLDEVVSKIAGAKTAVVASGRRADSLRRHMALEAAKAAAQ